VNERGEKGSGRSKKMYSGDERKFELEGLQGYRTERVRNVDYINRDTARQESLKKVVKGAEESVKRVTGLDRSLNGSLDHVIIHDRQVYRELTNASTRVASC
jgi:hypothetical protein